MPKSFKDEATSTFPLFNKTASETAFPMRKENAEVSVLTRTRPILPMTIHRVAGKYFDAFVRNKSGESPPKVAIRFECDEDNDEESIKPFE